MKTKQQKLPYSTQTTFQFAGISRAVPNSNHLYLAMFLVDRKKDRVGPSGNPNSACHTTNERKSPRLSGKSLQDGMDLGVEPRANSRLALFIPINSLAPITLGFDFRRYLKDHLFSRRSLISRNTCSAGFPRPGFRRASSARRSSSAICSGVRSSSLQASSSRTVSAISRWSSWGSLWICSRTSALLMTIVYQIRRLQQAGIRELPFVLWRNSSGSTQTPLQFIGISCAMENGYYTDHIIFDCKQDAVFAKPLKTNFSSTPHLWKMFRIGLCAFQRAFNFREKFFPQPWLLRFIPCDCIKQFCLSGRLKPKSHFHPKRFFASARTCSNGIPASGFSLKAATRRSRTAACSGVRPSSTHPSSLPNSSHIFSNSSRFSSAGKERICSMTSVALIDLNYQSRLRQQAVIRELPLRHPALPFTLVT